MRLIAFARRPTQRSTLGGGEPGRRLELLARLGSSLDPLGQIGLSLLVQQLVLAGLMQVRWTRSLPVSVRRERLRLDEWPSGEASRWVPEKRWCGRGPAQPSELERTNVLSLFALLATGRRRTRPLTLLERFEALALDGQRSTTNYVIALLAGDEAIALCSLKNFTVPCANEFTSLWSTGSVRLITASAAAVVYGTNRPFPWHGALGPRSGFRRFRSPKRASWSGYDPLPIHA